MTGILAQILTLIGHYNGEERSVELLEANSTFKHCARLRFVEKRKILMVIPDNRVVATKTVDWFKILENRGCLELLLVFQSDNSIAKDHKIAGLVGGGGNWLIEERHRDFSNFWTTKQKVKEDRKNDEQRIWNVSYEQVLSRAHSYPHPNYDVELSTKNLVEALEKIRNFSSSHKETSGWEKRFQEAIEATIESSTTLGYYDDMIPPSGLPLPNKQLLMASAKSFVFGGMGSWNDIGWFDDKKTTKEYDRVSEHLYSEMNNGILAAMNSRNEKRA